MVASRAVARPRVAASVILWREGARGRELYWVKRSGALRFAAGFYAFPGGKLDNADRLVPVVGAEGEAAALRACAVRELFEETGVLLARGPRLTPADRETARRELTSGSIRLADFLRRYQLTLDAAELEDAGRWITPPHVPLRYDTHFFLSQLPPGEEASVWCGEIVKGEWIDANDALERWGRGDLPLFPPNLWGVQCLSREGPPGCLERLRNPPGTAEHVPTRTEFQRGVFSTMLRTPTLPPATHTNCWLVRLGEDGLAVIDPGSPLAEEQAALEQVLDDLRGEGLTIREIWLTHHHGDHVGGVAPLRAAHPVVLRAHRFTLNRLPDAGPGPVVPLDDLDLIDGRFLAIHTPGHAMGHVAFFDERTRALFAGDMLSTLSTIVIDPPEGDMADYLHSLARLRDLAPKTLFPAHGGCTPDAVDKLDAYIAHRRWRETRILDALSAPSTLREATEKAYTDTPVGMLPVAERSCLASLQKLSREGRVRPDGELWRLA